jgi:predicted Zn-dependent protease with MMP-like domain
MKRENFVNVVEEALDSLPQEFRGRAPSLLLRRDECNSHALLRDSQAGGYPV